jgi:hypothetical protein
MSGVGTEEPSRAQSLTIVSDGYNFRSDSEAFQPSGIERTDLHDFLFGDQLVESSLQNGLEIDAGIPVSSTLDNTFDGALVKPAALSFNLDHLATTSTKFDASLEFSVEVEELREVDSPECDDSKRI